MWNRNSRALRSFLSPAKSSSGPPQAGRPRGAGVFIQPFGKSVPRAVAEVLLENQKLRPRLVCDNEQCCPKGVESMLQGSRSHAVISRSRALFELDRMPSRDWRLNAIAREAESGAVIADLASWFFAKSTTRSHKSRGSQLDRNRRRPNTRRWRQPRGKLMARYATNAGHPLPTYLKNVGNKGSAIFRTAPNAAEPRGCVSRLLLHPAFIKIHRNAPSVDGMQGVCTRDGSLHWHIGTSI